METIKEIPFSEYSKSLPLAREICMKILGKPLTANEVADRFNQVGEINRLIIKEFLNK